MWAEWVRQVRLREFAVAADLAIGLVGAEPLDHRLDGRAPHVHGAEGRVRVGVIERPADQLAEVDAVAV